MTLPTTITLPLNLTENDADNPVLLSNYLKRLVYEIATQIQRTNDAVNGRTIEYNQSSGFLFIQGSITPGTAVYTNTILTTRRINLMTFACFDITWSGHTGTGNTLITLPYTSQNIANNPYVSVIESDNNTFTAGYTYLTGNLTPNKNTIVVDQNGSGVPLLALPLPSSGHLRGSIFYAGQQFN